MFVAANTLDVLQEAVRHFFFVCLINLDSTKSPFQPEYVAHALQLHAAAHHPDHRARCLHSPFHFTNVVQQQMEWVFLLCA